MTKYSNEFKVKAIKMVLKGASISHVAKILNMPDIAPLCRWISHYEHGGIPQLLHKNRKYTPIFKQKVIEYGRKTLVLVIAKLRKKYTLKALLNYTKLAKSTYYDALKKLEKRLKQKQRQISRKYEINKIKKEGGERCQFMRKAIRC